MLPKKGKFWKKWNGRPSILPTHGNRNCSFRRLSLGTVAGLVLRGTNLLCGATGNCQTWVFRQSNGRWVGKFAQEAPIASGFGFEQQSSHGIKNLVLTSHWSAGTSLYTVFHFDGKVYAQTDCYTVGAGATAGGKRQTPCRASGRWRLKVGRQKMPTAPVTGATRGVGRGTAISLADTGFQVFAIGSTIGAAALPGGII